MCIKFSASMPFIAQLLLPYVPPTACCLVPTACCLLPAADYILGNRGLATWNLAVRFFYRSRLYPFRALLNCQERELIKTCDNYFGKIFRPQIKCAKLSASTHTSEFTSGFSAMQRPVSASRKWCKDSSCQLFAMEFPLCCRTAYRSIRLLLVHKLRVVLY